MRGKKGAVNNNKIKISGSSGALLNTLLFSRYCPLIIFLALIGVEASTVA